MTERLRVPGWDDKFESGKSKTYNSKTQCYMPIKHGLGYRRIIKSKNGPAIFGAWCALIQVLSRQDKPRGGWLTRDGRPDGFPMTAEDISLTTDMPVWLCEEMLSVCSSGDVGWLLVVPEGYHEDTVVESEGTIVERKCVVDGEGKGKGKGKGEGEGENDHEYLRLVDSPHFRSVDYERWLSVRRSYPNADPKQVVDELILVADASTRPINDPGRMVLGFFRNADGRASACFMDSKTKREIDLRAAEEATDLT